MRTRHFHNSIAICTLTLAVISTAGAGDLDPPAGPILPTMKPLDQVEPRIAINAANTPGDANSVFKIVQGGSYYLTANVAGESGKHGIEVFTGDPVTIDLNGFSLIGVAGSLDGINSITSTTVRNGAAKTWGGSGISVSQGNIDRVHALFNGGDGIRASSGSVVTNCITEANTGEGISVSDVTRVSGCASRNNQAHGIKADGACILSECVVYANAQGGIAGGVSSTVKDCMLFSNSVASIEVSNWSVVKDNHITSGTTGILATGVNNRIEGNTVVEHTTGFDIDGTDNVILRNTARGNTTSFDIVTGNAFGPIVSVNGVGDISTVTGADHPWANFEY